MTGGQAVGNRSVVSCCCCYYYYFFFFSFLSSQSSRAGHKAAPRRSGCGPRHNVSSSYGPPICARPAPVSLSRQCPGQEFAWLQSCAPSKPLWSRPCPDVASRVHRASPASVDRPSFCVLFDARVASRARIRGGRRRRQTEVGGSGFGSHVVVILQRTPHKSHTKDVVLCKTHGTESGTQRSPEK